MAASFTLSSRKPHDVPLPETPVKESSRAQKKQKGKGKEARNARSVGEGGVPSNEIAPEDGFSWSWATLADSSANNRPPVFTKDGRYFFSIVGSSVRIYSVVTGKVVSTLSPSSSGSSASRLSDGDGHTDLITAAILNPQNPFQLLTASLDGIIKVWDFLDAVLLQTIDFGVPISHMCAHERYKGHVFVAAATQNSEKALANREPGHTLIFRVSLKPSAETAQCRVSTSSEVIRIGKTRTANALAVSPSGSWLVAIAGCKAYVSTTTSLESGFTKFISPEKLTCLAFHPTDEYFATGDEKGQIRLWYCLNNQISFEDETVDKRAQTTVLHWHAHAVSSIAFTPNGAYLLSGGEESVLVIWQLHTGNKEFVPRVGAPISSVAVRGGGDGEEEYLLGLADSSFVFINAGSLTISRSFARIRLDPVISHQRPSLSTSVPLAVHPLSSCLILPSSHPSSLQTYSPLTSTLISELEVSPSNRVSRRDEKPIEPSRVERAIVCSSGEWMATIDRREGDDDFSAEGFLKIWRWEDSTWSLNTRIDRPHGGKSVTSISFSPKPVSRHGWLLMTAGLDGQVKTWGLRTLSTKDGKTEDYWTNRSTFTFRSKMPTDAVWSPDASLLAVVFGLYVTLHDPTTNTLLNTLTSLEVKAITSLSFMGQSGRYLLVYSTWDVILWDLVSRSIRWHFHSPHLVGHVVPHPQEDTVAVLTHPWSQEGDRRRRRTQIFIFGSSTPVVQEIKTLPFQLRSLTWYPTASSRFSIAGITHSWSVVLVGDEVHLPAEAESSRGLTSSSHSASRKTLFQDIFGQSAFAGVPADPISYVPVESRNSEEALAIFNTPAYLAPPIETLYTSLMDGFLTKRPEDAWEIKDAVDQVEQDEAMDVEETPGVPLTSRVVDDQEFDTFVELFKKQAVSTFTSVDAPVKPNGTSNGIHKPVLNGKHRSTPQSSPQVNGSSPHPLKKVNPRHAATASRPTSLPSSPVTAGKKRKKFVG